MSQKARANLRVRVKANRSHLLNRTLNQHQILKADHSSPLAHPRVQQRTRKLKEVLKVQQLSSPGLPIRHLLSPTPLVAPPSALRASTHLGPSPCMDRLIRVIIRLRKQVASKTKEGTFRLL